VDAGTAYIIMHESDEDDLKDTLEGCNINKDQYIFLPVNDKSITTEIGGGHWALLVWEPKKKHFYYFDSAGTMNFSCGKKLAFQLSSILLPDKYGFDAKKNIKNKGKEK